MRYLKALATFMTVGTAFAFISSFDKGSAYAAAPAADPAFMACAACHLNDNSGKSTFGPNLKAVVDRAVGKYPDYRYSPAMTKAGGTWTRERLDAFIAAPSKVVPGTRMPFAGIADPARRAKIVDYLLNSANAK